ncbi:MAG: hypothetical protein IJO54_08220 [Oscillospiraceae bacterium]|nr:hypothetical protein [Oscillospiraceae bacterium]
MGRAGGRGGGGGSRGGSFGGSRGGSFGGGRSSRSSGSFGGSSRSSSSFGSNRSYSSGNRTHTSGGSFWGPRTTGPIIINNSGNRTNRGYGDYNNQNRPVYNGSGNNSNNNSNKPANQQNSSGCLHPLLIMLMVISIFAVLSFAMASIGAKSSEKTKLVADVNVTSYYTDELGWIDNPSVLTDGMEYFYEKTGVQPHLYITDNVGGDFYDYAETFANSKYDQLFTDEAHLLLIFHEKDGWYDTYCLSGSTADTVIDSQARVILLDEIDSNYYDSSMDDNQFFSKSFEDAADKIMKKNPSYTGGIIIFLLVFLAALAAELYLRKKEKQAKRDKELKEMLEKPLETFGSSEAEELAKKYSADNGQSTATAETKYDAAAPQAEIKTETTAEPLAETKRETAAEMQTEAKTEAAGTKSYADTKAETAAEPLSETAVNSDYSGSTARFCTNCGNRENADHNFCSRCGTKLK